MVRCTHIVLSIVLCIKAQTQYKIQKRIPVQTTKYNLAIIIHINTMSIKIIIDSATFTLF